MNKDIISNSISFIDAKYIAEAEQYKETNNKRFKQFVSVAACLCLITIGALYLGTNINSPLNINTVQPNHTSIYIPPLALSDNTDVEGEADMIGFVVYQGKIYTVSQWYQGNDSKEISNLIGEHIGYAKGNIDEWSDQEDYAIELASTVTGDVYTVNGYDKDFRICVKEKSVDEEGKEVPAICFLENLNDISLNTGADLFKDRLKLSNWAELEYLTHQNWDHDTPSDYNYKKLSGVSNDDVESFLNALYTGKFEYNESEKFTDNRLESKQAHLYFKMNDGTKTELRLFEGGYVYYQHLGTDYYVKIEDDIFSIIFKKCQ